MKVWLGRCSSKSKARKLAALDVEWIVFYVTAIDIRNLNLNHEQLRAWYCNPSKHLVLQLEFPPYYWEGAEVARSSYVS